MLFTSDSGVALVVRLRRSILVALALVWALLYSCGVDQSQELRFVVTDIVALEELQTEDGALQKLLSAASAVGLRFFP